MVTHVRQAYLLLLEKSLNCSSDVVCPTEAKFPRGREKEREREEEKEMRICATADVKLELCPAAGRQLVGPVCKVNRFMAATVTSFNCIAEHAFSNFNIRLLDFDTLTRPKAKIGLKH